MNQFNRKSRFFWPAVAIASWGAVSTFAVAAAPVSQAQCALLPGVPTPPKNAISLSPSGSADDTNRIQQTLDQLAPGAWLVFQPGTYTIAKHISIQVPGVTIYGDNATIHASSPTDGAIAVKADNVSIFGITLTQDSTMRATTLWAGGITVLDDRTSPQRRIQGLQLQNNIVNFSGGAGIFLSKVSGFTIANNQIYRSWADGIHMTGGSRDGRVISNKVRQNGDDMIAVVSYAGLPGNLAASVRYANWTQQQDELDGDIYIAGNDVADQYWGRGISVVGGTNVTIDNNAIARTATGAGIYLTRETAYVTFGDQNILVTNNRITDVQTEPPTYMPAGFTETLSGHGGIEIAAEMLDDEVGNPIYFAAFSTKNISLAGNTISNARYDGIRIGIFSPPGSVSQVVIKSNALTKVASNSIANELSGFSASTGVCSANTLNNVNWGLQCVKAVPAVTANIAVAGASLTCDASGRIVPSIASRPQPPSSIRVN